MKIIDIKELRKEVEKKYLDKGYSDDTLENALHKDPHYPKDRIVHVTGYDLENNKVLGIFDNKKCEVTISQAAFNKGEELLAQHRSSEKSPILWSGHKIDENMEKAIPVKSLLILIESVIEKKDSVIFLVASKISRVAPASENGFKDIFSIKDSTPTTILKNIQWLRNESIDDSIKPKK